MEYLKEQLVRNAHEMELPKTMTIPELGGEERTLLRFVRARTKGKELAWEMLRNTLKWRKKWHVDECLERTFIENEKLYEQCARKTPSTSVTGGLGIRFISTT